MRDEDRLVAAIMDLTNQVARVAWALESQQRESPMYERDPCRKCGSLLVQKLAAHCSACLEPKKEKTDG